MGTGRVVSELPPARLLDVTRMVSRAGRVATGVDRVERAYLQELCRDPQVPLFAIARTALGYVLVDIAGATALMNATVSGEWGRIDLLAHLSRRADKARQRGQSFLRRNAIARCLPRNLTAMLRQHLPDGFSYINVGHSNLTERMLAAVRAIPKSRISVLVHDTIPLDYPDMQRPETVEAFAAKLRRVSSYADQVICTSVTCLKDVTRHMEDMGRVPPMLPAHIGVIPVTPDPSLIPSHLNLSQPYFVTVGTIEPRKNIAMLLDVWARLGTAAPGLLICGRRGWQSEDVFARLDRGVNGVIELPNLSDEAIAALLQGSNGLLFPSLVEGFGLPPAEAAALGVPVICADLPVYREFLGNTPVYLDASDSYLWENTVKTLAGLTQSTQSPEYVPPDWASHFKIVLTMA